MDDNSLTLGGDLPDLPLEPQIKDQVTVIFNKLRAEKRENELAKNLLPDIGKFIWPLNLTLLNQGSTDRQKFWLGVPTVSDNLKKIIFMVWIKLKSVKHMLRIFYYQRSRCDKIRIDHRPFTVRSFCPDTFVRVLWLNLSQPIKSHFESHLVLFSVVMRILSFTIVKWKNRSISTKFHFYLNNPKNPQIFSRLF